MTNSEIAPLSDADIIPAGASMARTSDSTAAIGQLMQHAQAMSAAYELASKLANTALVPAMYQKKPDDATAAILYGAELGLNPIQSLQQIFVVQGKPAIYARTMVALLKTRGYLIETIESTDTSVTVRGTDPQTGIVEESTWTIDRAKKAGYTSNKKYDTDPQAMLYAKAATEVARKIAPDVLLGIAHSREELELDAPVLATSERVKPKARGIAALQAALTPAAEPEPALDADSLLAAVEQAPDIESLREMWKQAAALTDEDCTTVRAVIDGRLADLKEPQ
ncbi:hypothetical protein [Prescottella equi]|uniref:RecT-like ssDNA binding protein n=1 Tax=Prescottella equi ATCC 33707 TaxID=525370 RepID=E9T0J2_RHOHA|nr:hypothetical protein [Prescottella equi]EGD23943.1 hypothetical protein HMPREF0724_12151 [Prescottella equi ATCC 33707]